MKRPNEFNELRRLDKKYDFIFVEFSNGHEHTLKAFGNYSMWIVSNKEGISNQIDYLKYIIKNENTFISDIKYTNSKEEAIEMEIITEELGFL